MKVTFVSECKIKLPKCSDKIKNVFRGSSDKKKAKIQLLDATHSPEVREVAALHDNPF